MIIAYLLGASIFTDIFFTAMRLPNLFRSLFAEGAFTSSFIPIYGSILKEDKTKAGIFLSKVFSVLLIALTFFTIVAEFNMEFIIEFFAPGFKTSEYFSLLVLISRIMFPYIIFISLVALTSGSLQTIKKFSAIAISPIILNLVIICASLYSFNAENHQIVVNISISVVIAGIIQLTLMMFNLYKNGIEITLKEPLTDESLKLFFKKVLPTSFSACIYQLNIFVDTFFASSITFGVSYLYYADRINQLPLSLIGVSLSTVILPLISESLRSNDFESASSHQNKALEIALVLAIPAAVGLFLLADPIIRTVFMNSLEFSIEAAIETAKTLKIFAFALPAYVFNKIFLNTFFANGDTKTPLIFAIVALMINIIANYFLIDEYKHLGIAFASTVSAWVNLVLILYSLRKKNLFKIADYISKVFAQVFFASSIMIFVIEILVNISEEIFLSGIMVIKLSVIGIICIISASTYFTIWWLIRKFVFAH